MKLYLSTTTPYYFCARWPDGADTTNTGAVEEIDPDGRGSWPSRDEARLANLLLARGIRITVRPSTRADMAIVRECADLVGRSKAVEFMAGMGVF